MLLMQLVCICGRAVCGLGYLVQLPFRENMATQIECVFVSVIADRTMERYEIVRMEVLRAETKHLQWHSDMLQGAGLILRIRLIAIPSTSEPGSTISFFYET